MEIPIMEISWKYHHSKTQQRYGNQRFCDTIRD